MLADIVVDTCVLAHANSRSDGGDALHLSAKQFLLKLLAAQTVLAVDPGIRWPPTAAQSKIWCEYRDTGAFAYGTSARDFLVALLATNRVREVQPLRLDGVARYTGAGLDPRFVRVAAATSSKRLVTHDRGFRGRDLDRRFGVTVNDCNACLADLD